MTTNTQTVLTVGDVRLEPTVVDGCLTSLGAVSVGGVPLRNPATRFLPWFDTYDGDIFRRFRVDEICDGALRLRAVSDPDTLFRERRDCSGDPCFRAVNWDADPLESALTVRLEPAEADLDGRHFTGLRYWFEYAGTPIHRLVDRQTWEVGGNLDDVTICLRNWLTPPRMRIARDTTYSTVGLDKWAGLLPGNLWGRWSLLPAFDMQYGQAGVVLGWFDAVSLIRTVIESNAGEDSLRCLDLHLFAQSDTVRTNPKTILWSPDVLDDVDALNLWTRVQDQEAEKARQQFGIGPEEPPALTFGENVWRGFRFDTTYEHVVDVASEFGADYVFIDPVWQHNQALAETLEEIIPAEHKENPTLKKFGLIANMCITLDFEVADVHGGEAGLKALCDRARAKGVKIISWMAAHMSATSAIRDRKDLGHGANGIFAAKESGRHPDTGYPAECWTLNLNAPIYERMREQVLGVCARTGLSGFLWDSYSNLGWWQVDYSDGSMRPQFEKMAGLYADLVNAGLYVQPEAITTFSNHSCCGLHGGNIYAGDLLGFSYNTNIGFWFGDGDDHGAGARECRILAGEAPFEMLFQAIAHKRVPSLHFHTVPREEWHPGRTAQIKELFAAYRACRGQMVRRTVLKGGAGVRWDSDDGTVLFSFIDQAPPFAGAYADAVTGEPATALRANGVYRVTG
jgi:hypothetical protein